MRRKLHVFLALGYATALALVAVAYGATKLIGYLDARSPGPPIRTVSAAPAAAPVAPPAKARPITGGAQAPLPSPKAQPEAPRAVAVDVAPPQKPAPTSAPAVTPSPVAAPSPSRKTEATPSVEAPPAMSPGAVVADGAQAPALVLELPADVVAGLVSSGRAYVFALSDADKDIAFLAAGWPRFLPIGELKAPVSIRVFALDDASAAEAWRAQVASLAGSPPRRFALRFAAAFERRLLQAQFDALARERVDFEDAKARHRAISMHGRFTEDFGLAIDSVSVE